MATFTINLDNNITAHDAVPSAAPDTQIFASEKELAKLSASWPISRLVETWNSLAGVAPFDDLRPVKKFTDRRKAARRIWQAIQRLTGTPAPQVAHSAPKKGKAKKAAAKETGRTTARDGSKKADVIAMLRRPKGATLSTIMKTTGWQAHTVRGFVSGTLTKKLGLKVESFRGEDKERTYRLCGAPHNR